MSTIKVTDASFEAEVLKSATPVVVDFWAEWCGPCKIIGPHLEEIAKELGPRAKIVKLNIDENPAVASQLGIRSIPTLMVFKAGKHTSTQVGAGPKNALKNWIEGAL
jgi:thioredoxin 1